MSWRWRRDRGVRVSTNRRRTPTQRTWPHRLGGVVVEEANVDVVRERLRPAVFGAVPADLPHLCGGKSKKPNRWGLAGIKFVWENTNENKCQAAFVTILGAHDVVKELWTVDDHDLADAGRLPAGQVIPHPRTHWGGEDAEMWLGHDAVIRFLTELKRSALLNLRRRLNFHW